MSSPRLEALEIVGGYGDLRVLWGVSVAADAGRVTAVLGRNGAGKTSLLKAIAGFLPAMESGKVCLDGKVFNRAGPDARVRAGLGFVQEGKRIFRQRTVEENLLLGGYTLRRPLLGVGPTMRAALDRAYERFPILASRRHAAAGGLSGGQQQMLAIAQALMAAPTVLLLDEPSAGLAPAISNDVFAMVQALKAEGLAIVLVEQGVEQALAVADDVVVIESGRVAASGPVSQFDDATVVRDVYLGRRPGPERPESGVAGLERPGAGGAQSGATGGAG
ncbi:MAG: ABC transporter ATP-binding protein, partial [Acidimicrobiaceae bacterium]|nr:ABC transporter ATP-binding protein [Acidimicrobiaceae bacterium]